MNNIYKKHKKKIFIVVFMLFVDLILAGLYAKYLKDVSFDAKITISAHLAEEVELFEHEIIFKNGVYVLGEEKVTENEYYVVPGADIPKDPQIVIKDKSVINAYLYIEVVDTISNASSGITYQLADCWIKLDEVKGKKGGQIYVYSSDENQATLLSNQNTNENPIYILENNKISVSENISSSDFQLDFYGYMAEVSSENLSAEDVYNKCFISQTNNN